MATSGNKPGGAKTGGRLKGTPNKLTQEVQHRLAELGCDPIAGMARIAEDVTPCLVCTHGLLEDGRVCGQCQGTGKLQSPPELRGRMYAELAQYVAPKRKAIEVSGPDGGAIELSPARREQILQRAALMLEEGQPAEDA